MKNIATIDQNLQTAGSNLVIGRANFNNKNWKRGNEFLQAAKKLLDESIIDIDGLIQDAKGK